MGTFTLRQTGPVSLEVSRGKWKITIEPGAEFGGQDAGPTPTELTAISVAACEAITAMIWMKGKGKPASGLEAEVSYEYAEKPRRISKVTTVLRGVRGKLDAAQQLRLEQVVREHCWVAQTFEHRPEIVVVVE